MVPYCSDLKHKLERRRLFKRVQQEELLRRRSSPRKIRAGQRVQNVKDLIFRAQMNAIFKADQPRGVVLIPLNSMGNLKSSNKSSPANATTQQRKADISKQQQVIPSFSIELIFLNKPQLVRSFE